MVRSPGASAFEVKVTPKDGSETTRPLDVAVSGAVLVSGKTVTLTLATAVVAGDTVTVSYAVPTGADAMPIRDASGNNAAALNDEAVDERDARGGGQHPSGAFERDGKRHGGGADVRRWMLNEDSTPGASAFDGEAVTLAGRDRGGCGP